MTPRGLISPTHRSIHKYHENLRDLHAQQVFNEMSVRLPFESLLADTAKLEGWTVVPELSAVSGGGQDS